MGYLYLAIAIASEVTATLALKSADGFSRLGPSLIVLAGYGLAGYMLSLTLRTIPVGVAYATWASAGIVLIAVLAVLLYNQRIDLPAALGMGMIVGGVLLLNLGSGMSVH